MNIQIVERVLNNPKWHPVLDVIVEIVQLPESHAAFDLSQHSSFVASSWLSNAVGVRASISQLIKSSARTSGRNVSSDAVTLIVDDAAPPEGEIISASQMRVMPLKALAVLMQPLYVIVEDESSDGGFILWMARLLGRDSIRRAYNAGRLVFRHSGGKTQMLKSARALTFGVWPRADRPILSLRLRAVAMLDSDSRFPGDTRNHAIRNEIEPHVAFAHLLKSRAIENYIPKQFFQRRLPNATRAVDAYFRMNEEQRAHFPLKTGFTDGASPPNPQRHNDFLVDDRLEQQERALYSTVFATDWVEFARGFGTVLSDVFREAKYRCDPMAPGILTMSQRNEIDQFLNQVTRYL